MTSVVISGAAVDSDPVWSQDGLASCSVANPWTCLSTSLVMLARANGSGIKQLTPEPMPGLTSYAFVTGRPDGLRSSRSFKDIPCPVRCRGSDGSGGSGSWTSTTIPAGCLVRSDRNADPGRRVRRASMGRTAGCTRSASTGPTWQTLIEPQGLLTDGEARPDGRPMARRSPTDNGSRTIGAGAHPRHRRVMGSPSDRSSVTRKGPGTRPSMDGLPDGRRLEHRAEHALIVNRRTLPSNRSSSPSTPGGRRQIRLPDRPSVVCRVAERPVVAGFVVPGWDHDPGPAQGRRRQRPPAVALGRRPRERHSPRHGPPTAIRPGNASLPEHSARRRTSFVAGYRSV